MGNKILCTLTYAPHNAPNTTTEAKKRLATFIQRLRRYAKNHGFAPLCYKPVADFDEEKHETRIHHHVVINFSDGDAVTKLWGNGLTRCQPITDEQYQNILKIQ